MRNCRSNSDGRMDPRGGRNRRGGRILLDLLVIDALVGRGRRRR